MSNLFVTADAADRMRSVDEIAAELKRRSESPGSSRQGDVMASLDLTSYSSGKYAWSEQALDASGVRYTKTNGLSGTTSYMPAKTPGASKLGCTGTLPVWLRPVSVCGTLGLVWEIVAIDLASLPSYSGAAVQVLGHDASGCLKWYDVSAC